MILSKSLRRKSVKLIDLRIKNFRQFYGDTPPIVFAEGEKNVTVIVGTNGG